MEAEAAQSTEGIDKIQDWMDASRHISDRLETLTDDKRAELFRLVVYRAAVVGQEFQICMLLDSREYIPSRQHYPPA